MSSYADQLQQLQDAIIHKQPLQEPLKPHHTLEGEQLVAIYAQGYRMRLLNLLLNSYPATRHLLGDEAFRAIAADYIEKTPSTHRNIDRYALPFAACLSQTEAAGEAAALAKLEAANSEIFLLPDCEPLTPEHLQKMDETAFATMPLYLRRSARLIALDYAVNDYLSAFRQGQPLPEISSESQYVLSFRHERQAHRAVLPKDEFLLLTLLNEGKPLMVVLEEMGEGALSAEWLQLCFNKWIKSHYITVPLQYSSN